MLDLEKLDRLYTYLETLQAKLNSLDNRNFLVVYFGKYVSTLRYYEKAKECIRAELQVEIGEVEADIKAELVKSDRAQGASPLGPEGH